MHTNLIKIIIAKRKKNNKLISIKIMIEKFDMKLEKNDIRLQFFCIY